MIVNGLLSGSESFVNKLPVATASSCIFTVSGATTGGSFTGVTVMLSVPEVTPPFPSETAYVIAGSVPKYPRLGVNVYVPFAFTITDPTPVNSTIEPAG